MMINQGTSNGLTVLSFGGGQDSTAILYAIAHMAEWRQRYAPGDLLVVMADTGDEHPSTKKHVERVKGWALLNGIEFHHITPDLGFHQDGWKTLRHQWDKNQSVGMKRGAKSCTDQLKIRPIYRFLESWISKRYGFASPNGGRGKPAIRQFAKTHGPIRMLIGIAKGEERRVADPAKDPNQWRRDSVTMIYPLITEGLDRRGCQELIASLGYDVPTPSNCVLCPFMSKVELLWLSRRMPADFAEWVRFEDQKLAKYAAKGIDPKKNLTVWGTKRLNEVLAQAEAEFGHMTEADLDEYKMSHGHCVASRY
jgi:hypothetical protein